MRADLGYVAMLLLSLSLAAGCGSSKCKAGTIFLSYTLPQPASTIAITLSINGGAPQTQTVARQTTALTGSIEIQFGTYPAGQPIDLLVVASNSGQIVASGSDSFVAASSCSSVELSLTTTEGDLGGAPVDLPATGDDLLGASSDLAPSADLAPLVDLIPPSDLMFIPGASCTGLASNCGANGDDSCCHSGIVTGTKGAEKFKRSYDGNPDGGYEDPAFEATVSDFRLDKYEVTVGRFRKFVEAGKAFAANAPSSGAGAHPWIASSGWDSAWNASLLADVTALNTALNCAVDFPTWTDAVSTNENRPITCTTWYEAFAFCIWDGGFLPTETEWNYAASGGLDQRVYPWSMPSTSTTIDTTYAFYDCNGGACGNISSIGEVGNKPKGDGRFGQSDLTGNMGEWVLDWYQTPYAITPCNDCFDSTVVAARGTRGNTFLDGPLSAKNSWRFSMAPATRTVRNGLRCARRK